MGLSLSSCIRGSLDTVKPQAEIDSLDLAGNYTTPSCVDSIELNYFKMNDKGTAYHEELYWGETFNHNGGQVGVRFESRTTPHNVRIYYPENYLPIVSRDYEIGTDPSASEKVYIKVLAGQVGNYYLYTQAGATVHHKVLSNYYEVTICGLQLFTEDGDPAGEITFRGRNK